MTEAQWRARQRNYVYKISVSGVDYTKRQLKILLSQMNYATQNCKPGRLINIFILSQLFMSHPLLDRKSVV